MTRDQLFPLNVVLQAQHSERETGLPTPTTLAQWALESDYGSAMSGQNNPFGIKGTPGTLCWTWEVIGGKNIHVQASFKNFPSLEAAFDYHGEMLTRPDGYYASALKYIKDPSTFIPAGDKMIRDWRSYTEAIAHIYATDPAYSEKLIHIIEVNELYGFSLPQGE